MPPFGENTSLGNEVFSTFNKDDRLQLRVSGEVYGAVISKKSYRKLPPSVKSTLGGRKWPPRESLLKDSGILYHSVGEHDASTGAYRCKGRSFRLCKDTWAITGARRHQ